MSKTRETRPGELERRRRLIGLTQAELALLVGVTQQAIAKWERVGSVPEHRLKTLAQNLRVSTETLLSPDDGTQQERESRVQAWVGDTCGDSVVVGFENANFHYIPTSSELQAFWRSLQKDQFAHLSAGPVQVLVNVREARTIDFVFDPDLDSYEPKPVTSAYPQSHISNALHLRNVDGDDDSDQEGRHWFENAEARVYIRGRRKQYDGPQMLFDETLNKENPTTDDLVDLQDAFQHERADSNSIFDLFAKIFFAADLDPSVYDKGEELHPDALHVFQSDDDGNGPQLTWAHTRDIQVIEIPTRLWEVFILSISAHNAADSDIPPERRNPKRTSRHKQSNRSGARKRKTERRSGGGSRSEKSQ